MERKEVAPLAVYFAEIVDPRIERKKLYPLIEVMLLTILAHMSGAEGWEDIEYYGRCKEAWLKQWLELKNGIPQHDVYRRVFARLDPEQLERCFMEWVAAMQLPLKGQVIAIDGKTLRGSADTFKLLKAVHMVSAYATEQQIVLAQVKTDTKSNEITAIPELLGMLALKGAIVTIDAMGCQYEIANQITKGGGDYLFSLKGNQGRLREDVEEYLKDTDFAHPAPGVAVHVTTDVDHGRIEKRSHAVTGDVAWLRDRHPLWDTIRSIGMIEAQRDINGAVSVERRYYISSLAPDVAVFAHAARAHWGIENSLHHVLDVTYREDGIKIRCGNAPENLHIIRKIALNLARSDTGSKLSVKKRLKGMGWSEDYLLKLLSNFKPPF